MKTFKIMQVSSQRTNFIDEFPAQKLIVKSVYKKKGGKIDWVVCEGDLSSRPLSVMQGELATLHKENSITLVSDKGKEIRSLKIGDQVQINPAIKIGRDENGNLFVEQ